MEANTVQDGENFTIVEIEKQKQRSCSRLEKEVNEDATDIFHQLRKIVLSCSNEEEESIDSSGWEDTASLPAKADSCEEWQPKEGTTTSEDESSQENPKEDIGQEESVNKMSKLEERSGLGRQDENDEAATDVFHELRKILMTCSNEEDDSERSLTGYQEENIEADPDEEWEPEEGASLNDDDTQENTEEEAEGAFVSKVTKQEEMLVTSLEVGNDERAMDIFQKLKEALLSCNNEDEDSDWSYHGNEDVPLDEEVNFDEEWHPKGGASPSDDDQDAQDGEDEEDADCSKETDMDEAHLPRKTKKMKPPQMYQCKYCEKCFRYSSCLKKHETVHTREKPFKCQYCEKCFSSAGNRVSHERTHTGEKPYNCQYCNKAFASHSSIRRHKLMNRWNNCCVDGSLVKAVSNQGSDNVDENSRKKAYLCHFCGKSFATLRGCKGHIFLHTAGRAMSEPKPHRCDYCGKCFICNSDLKIHLRIHTGEKNYRCSTCGRAFAKKTHCREHERIHNGEKPYKCKVCDQSFTWKRTCRRHELRHEQIRVRKVLTKSCPYCGKNIAHSLQRHINMVHKKIKPHKCQVCDSCFAERSGLKKHAMTHSGLKNYQCSFCGKLFRHKRSCSNHENVRHIRGKPKYFCQYCNKVYTTKKFLELHEKKHFAEKKYYMCNTCGKKYTASFSLMRHLRTHTGQKPYQCSICYKSFIRKDYRDDHEKTHVQK